MKKTFLFISLLVILSIITACAPTQEAIVLSVDGQVYSKSELEAIGTMSVDYTDKDGETTTYEGVLLSEVLNNAGVDGDTITFTAADGYEAEMPLEDAMACSDCIVAFDDGSLRMVMPEQSGKLQVKDVVEISVN